MATGDAMAVNAAIVQLARTRPPATGLRRRLVSPLALEHEPFEASWSYNFHPAAPAWRSRALSTDGELCFLAAFTDLVGNIVPGVLRWVGANHLDSPAQVFINLPQEVWFEHVVNIGTRSDGVFWLSYYAHGADLRTLARAGVRLSWSAATCLYAAARFALSTLHHAGRHHEALTPARIRLALFEEHTALVATAPIRFVGQRHHLGFALGARDERLILARAVAALAEHPDPRVEALLRDPTREASEVLRDLLLERAPVDELLADHCRSGVATTPYADTPELDTELAALWQRVVALEPLIV